MLKIHIIGGPGSGKTTLGQEIASRFNIPHHDLDQLGWKNGTDHAAYVKDAFAIAQQPGWVTENIGLIWIDPLLICVRNNADRRHLLELLAQHQR